MLLANLKLIEVNTSAISFEHSLIETTQGKMRVEYGEIAFEAGAVIADDESKATIQVNASPAIYGFRDDAEGDDFSLKIAIRMLYSYPRSEKIDESFLRDNQWYFASFLKTYFKFYAEDILQKTSISGIKLAYN